MDLEELLRLAEKRARSLFKKGKQVPPTWILFDGKTVHLLATPWDSEAERQLAKLVLAEAVKEYKIIAYGFVSEVWISVYPMADIDKPHPQPRKDPNRKEMIFSLATDGKTIRQRGWQIVRDWNEKVIKLEAKGEQEGGFSGWIVSLLGTPDS